MGNSKNKHFLSSELLTILSYKIKFHSALHPGHKSFLCPMSLYPPKSFSSCLSAIKLFQHSTHAQVTFTPPRHKSHDGCNLSLLFLASSFPLFLPQTSIHSFIHFWGVYNKPRSLYMPGMHTIHFFHIPY